MAISRKSLQSQDLFTKALEVLVNGLPVPAEERGYPTDYNEFIETQLGVHLYDKQREIVESVQHNRRTAVKSCHAGGKSLAIAALTIAFLHIETYSKVVITGPSADHVEDIVWGNIRGMYERAPGKLIGEPYALRWRLAPDWYAVGIKPSDYRPGLIQGHHAPKILVIGDEAAEVAKAILDGLESLMTGGGAHMLLTGNPTDISGTFHGAFHENSSLWNCITIKSTDTPNIKAGTLVTPGLLDQEWIDEQIVIWGEDHDWVRARVHAEFPIFQANAWVPLAHVERAQKRVTEGTIHATRFALDPVDIGIDVARTGDDKSVIAFRQGEWLWGCQEWKLGNLMQSVGEIRYAILTWRATIAKQLNVPDAEVRFRMVNVDETGLGAGVADRLTELHQDGELEIPVEHIRGVNFAEAGSNREWYQNRRQELWWGLRERFLEERICGNLPQVFISDITSAAQKPNSTYSKPQVEKKEDMKKRLHRSPDYADAVALAYWVDPMLVGQGGSAPVSVESSGHAHYLSQSDDDWDDE